MNSKAFKLNIIGILFAVWLTAGIGLIVGSYADGIITSGMHNITNGTIEVIRIYLTNDMYEVQFNPHALSNGWQTVYSTTNFTSALGVLKKGLASVTNQ